jgi:hypothetical protein
MVDLKFVLLVVILSGFCVDVQGDDFPSLITANASIGEFEIFPFLFSKLITIFQQSSWIESISMWITIKPWKK